MTGRNSIAATVPSGRLPVDRDVEAHVHRRKHHCEPDDRLSRGAVRPDERVPRSSPEHEDRGGTRDPEPGYAERLDAGEEEHGERGPEVVEERASPRSRAVVARSSPCGRRRHEGPFSARRPPRRHGRRVRVIVEWPIDGAEDQLPRKARTRDASTFEGNLLDETNLRILGELRQDGRLGLAELGRRIGLSAPAVAERVAAVRERAGAIRGYHAELDPAALGFPVAAVVRIRPSPGQLQGYPRSPERRSRSASVTESRARTATSSAFISARSTSWRRSSTTSTPHGLTTTSIIHSTPVPRRGPPLSA